MVQTSLVYGSSAHISMTAVPTSFGCCLITVLVQVGNNGGIEGLVVDTAGRYISSTYARRISLHEAGHFLIAYLIGLLPRAYTLSTLDAVQRCTGNADCLRLAIHAATMSP